MNVFNDILGIEENQSEPPVDRIQVEMMVLEDTITRSQMKQTEAIDAVFEYIARFRVDKSEHDCAIVRAATEKSGKMIRSFPEQRQGVALIGGIGCGKTIALEALSRFTRCKIRAVPKMAIQFAVQGTDSMQEYLEMTHPLIIDDIGAEKQLKSYGSAFPIEEIIYLRYNLWQKKGVHTHFATNLSAKDFEDRYGVRILDRIKEMCAVKNLTGRNLRA